MKLGFLTGCLSPLPLDSIVAWAAQNGFTALELSAWPVDNARDYSGTQLDAARLDQAEAARIRALFDQHHLTISCVTYCDNNLAHDPAERARYLNHLQAVIRAAALLGAPTVSTFIGRDITLTLEQNLEEAKQVFTPIVAEAKRLGVKIGIENCPMPDWQFEGLAGNVAFSPALWARLFELIPAENFGLNFDPSHLAWLGVDYLAALRDFAPRIFHMHAKDTEIFPERRSRYSIMEPSHGVWWRYRMPGLGMIDWGAFIGTLRKIGYNGTLSTEHEDPEWEGSEEKVKRGLILGREHLQKFAQV